MNSSPVSSCAVSPTSNHLVVRSFGHRARSVDIALAPTLLRAVNRYSGLMSR